MLGLCVILLPRLADSNPEGRGGIEPIILTAPPNLFGVLITACAYVRARAFACVSSLLRLTHRLPRGLQTSTHSAGGLNSLVTFSREPHQRGGTEPVGGSPGQRCLCYTRWKKRFGTEYKRRGRHHPQRCATNTRHSRNTMRSSRLVLLSRAVTSHVRGGDKAKGLGHIG